MKNAKKCISRGLVIGILIAVMASVATAPASAWCWQDGQVVSNSEDIPSDLNPYIKKVEYDAYCGLGAGARLYLTKSGDWSGLWLSNAEKMAEFIVEDSGWWAGDRGTESVAYEIAFHCPVKTNPIHIEYYYADLLLCRFEGE